MMNKGVALMKYKNKKGSLTKRQWYLYLERYNELVKQIQSNKDFAGEELLNIQETILNQRRHFETDLDIYVLHSSRISLREYEHLGKRFKRCELIFKKVESFLPLYPEEIEKTYMKFTMFGFCL